MPNDVINTRRVGINVSNSNNNQPRRPQVRRRATPPAQPRPVSRNRNLQVPRVPNILSNLSPFRRRKSTRSTRKIKGYKDTPSQGKKRKTKVNDAKKSKRASQKKRGRKMSKRQRGGNCLDSRDKMTMAITAYYNFIGQLSEEEKQNLWPKKKPIKKHDYINKIIERINKLVSCSTNKDQKEGCELFNWVQYKGIKFCPEDNGVSAGYDPNLARQFENKDVRNQKGETLSEYLNRKIDLINEKKERLFTSHHDFIYKGLRTSESFHSFFTKA